MVVADPSEPARPTSGASRVPESSADPRANLVRLTVHVVLAGLPLLAISAHVFGLLPMRLSAALVVLPLAIGAVLLALFDPLPSERIVLRGAAWGMVATLVYDAFRWDTVYLLGWWGDFIPTMGTWIIDAPEHTGAGAVAGYLWRYLGDGAGIGVVFFLLVAATGLQRIGRWRLVAVATVFAVVPVWSGLIATVGLSSLGQELMFALTPTTVALSLIGHLVFGVVLGLGCARSRDLGSAWPWTPLLDRPPLAAWAARVLPGATATAPGAATGAVADADPDSRTPPRVAGSDARPAGTSRPPSPAGAQRRASGRPLPAGRGVAAIPVRDVRPSAGASVRRVGHPPRVPPPLPGRCRPHGVVDRRLPAVVAADEPDTEQLSFDQLIAAHGRAAIASRPPARSRREHRGRVLSSSMVVVATLAIVATAVVVTPAASGPGAEADASATAVTPVAAEVSVVARVEGEEPEGWQSLDEAVVDDDVAVQLRGDLAAVEGRVRYVLRAPQGATSEAITRAAPYAVALPMGSATEGSWRLDVLDDSREILTSTTFVVAAPTGGQATNR